MHYEERSTERDVQRERSQLDGTLVKVFFQMFKNGIKLWSENWGG